MKSKKQFVKSQHQNKNRLKSWEAQKQEPSDRTDLWASMWFFYNVSISTSSWRHCGAHLTSWQLSYCCLTGSREGRASQQSGWQVPIHWQECQVASGRSPCCHAYLHLSPSNQQHLSILELSWAPPSYNAIHYWSLPTCSPCAGSDLLA